MTGQDPAIALSRGMAALLERRAAELDAGAAPVGWKIGFNTPAIQKHFGLSDPVVGYLTDTGVTPDGGAVDLTGWTAPAVEVEVAIRVDDQASWAAWHPPSSWSIWTSPSTISSRSWPATSSSAASCSATRSRGWIPGP